MRKLIQCSALGYARYVSDLRSRYLKKTPGQHVTSFPLRASASTASSALGVCGRMWGQAWLSTSANDLLRRDGLDMPVSPRVAFQLPEINGGLHTQPTVGCRFRQSSDPNRHIR